MPSIFPALTASSISDLAAKLELDPIALEKTLAEFNRAVVPGTFDHTRLDDCRTGGLRVPKSHWARPIDQPPYYAYPLRPGITFTYLGVKVSQEGRMVMSEERASANMFAAGEIMAGNVLGKGYLAGIGMTIGSVFGRVAGEGAAAHAAN
jgi:tricarballylate dehydrogenase